MSSTLRARCGWAYGATVSSQKGRRERRCPIGVAKADAPSFIFLRSILVASLTHERPRPAAVTLTRGELTPLTQSRPLALRRRTHAPRPIRLRCSRGLRRFDDAQQLDWACQREDAIGYAPRAYHNDVECLSPPSRICPQDGPQACHAEEGESS